MTSTAATYTPKFIQCLVCGVGLAPGRMEAGSCPCGTIRVEGGRAYVSRRKHGPMLTPVMAKV